MMRKSSQETATGKKKMSNQGFVLAYVQSCTAGDLGMAECGPVWQLAVIAALLFAAIMTLALLQVRRPSPDA
jgi:hypothetical protein